MGIRSGGGGRRSLNAAVVVVVVVAFVVVAVRWLLLGVGCGVGGSEGRRQSVS